MTSSIPYAASSDRSDRVILRICFQSIARLLAWIEVQSVASPSTGSFSRRWRLRGVDIRHFRDRSQVCLGWLDPTTLDPELLDIRKPLRRIVHRIALNHSSEDTERELIVTAKVP